MLHTLIVQGIQIRVNLPFQYIALSRLQHSQLNVYFCVVPLVSCSSCFKFIAYELLKLIQYIAEFP